MVVTLLGVIQSGGLFGSQPYNHGGCSDKPHMKACGSRPPRVCPQRRTCTKVDLRCLVDFFDCIIHVEQPLRSLQKQRCLDGIDAANYDMEDICYDDSSGRDAVRLSSTVPTASPSHLDALLAGAVQAALLGSASFFLCSGGPAGLSVACLPILPYWGDEDPLSLDTGLDITSRSRMLRRSFVTICLGQASVGAIQLSFGDAASGFINLGISSIGLQASTPNSHRLLQSYTVLAFCNGTMQVLLGVESLANTSTLLHSAAPLAVKASFLTALAAPSFSILGLVFAYQLYKEMAVSGVPMAMTPGAGNDSSAVTADGIVAATDARNLGFRPYVGMPHRLEPRELPKDSSSLET